MKVLKDFFCIVEKKNYKEGQEYDGNRKDIPHLLESIKEVKEEKVAIETKQLKIKRQTKGK